MDGFPVLQKGRVTVHPSVSSLQGDAALLQQAAHALLDNALKAGEGDVTWELGENSMSFSNVGTLAEDVDFFEPWARGDQGRSTSGSGLGLPIVFQIMRLHGGQATIRQSGETVVASLIW